MKSVLYVPNTCNMTGGDKMRFELIWTFTKVYRRKINLSRFSLNELSNVTAEERISDYCVRYLCQTVGDKQENKKMDPDKFFKPLNALIPYNIMVTQVYCVVLIFYK